MSLPRAALLLPLLALAGCGDSGPPSPSPQQLAERAAVFRQACAAREMNVRAEEDVEVIEAAVVGDPSDPNAAFSQMAARAALDFSRAYLQHTELRRAAYALLDSAVNHSASAADSARYIQRAAAFTVSVPQGGSVEANVLNQYLTNLDAILTDDDNRCNWDLPDFAR